MVRRHGRVITTLGLLERVDQGLINRDVLIAACLGFMSEDDVQEMIRLNDFFGLDELNEDDEDDGQPDEAQEWHDFDPDC